VRLYAPDVVLLRRVPLVIVTVMLAMTSALLLSSMSWGTSGWTVGESTVRNDYLLRVALLGAVTLLAARVTRRNADGMTVAILWVLAATAVVIQTSPVAF
jgi:hypothetical protein